MEQIAIPILKVSQNDWTMYLGVMNAKDLNHIAEVDRIRVESLKIPKYAGYQRALLDDRVNSIRDYLKTPDATFPNAIIISIDSEYIDNWTEIRSTNDASIMTLRLEPGAARIIDGQHRNAALDAAPNGFQVIVTIFIDLEMIKCAQIFAKINSTQKAVNPSIAFQLFGYSEQNIPQKVAHDIADTLNNSEGSPFYKRLRMLGSKDAWATGVLSQSTFCKHLMTLYSKKPEVDENMLLRGGHLESYSDLPLRTHYVKGQYKQILEIVWKYFFEIATNWPDQWNDESKKSILPKTTGYNAFMQILKLWLLEFQTKIDYEVFRKSLQKVKKKYEEAKHRFIRSNYAAGNQGVIELREKLKADLF